MKIEKIHIDSFGALCDRDFSFLPGINVIEGENETGKSTLCAFIKFMLYGFGSRTDERSHGISFATGTAKGTMTFTAMGHRYRIERSVVMTNTTAAQNPSFRENLQTIDLDLGTPAFPKTEPGLAVFGVDADVFLSTVLVRQIGDSAVGGKPLKESVENILFSANEDINTKKALKKLDEMRVFYLHKNKKGGKLFEMQMAQNDLSERLSRAKRAGEQLNVISSSVREARNAKEANLAKMEHHRRLKAAGEELTNLSKYEQVEELLAKEKQEMQKATAILRQLFGTDSLPERDFITELRLCSTELTHFKKSMEEAQASEREMDFHVKQENPKEDLMRKLERQGGMEMIKSKMRSLKNKQTAFLISAIATVLLTVLSGAAFGAVAVLQNMVSYPLMGATVALLVFSILFFANRGNTIKKTEVFLHEYRCDTMDEFDNFLEEYSISEARLKLHTENLEQARLRTKQATEEYLSCAQKGAAILDELKRDENAVVDPQQLQPEHLDSIASQLDVVMKEYQRHLGEAAKYRSAHDTVLQQLKAFGSEEDIRNRISALVRTWQNDDLEHLDTAKLDREVEFAVKANAALEERLVLLYQQQAELMAQTEDPRTLESELKKTNQEYTELCKKFQAYQLAMEALRCASDQLRSTVTPRICAKAGKVLGIATDGKYENVGLDEDYTLHYTTESEAHPVEFLSAGTRDLAYFSLRLALAELLFRTENPPLIFDESFVKMDDKRLGRTMAVLLHEANNDVQSLIFTCHAREREVADHIGVCNTVKLS